MKEKLIAIIQEAVESFAAKHLEEGVKLPQVGVTIPKHKAHGDYATNIAMPLAGIAKMKPRDIAEELVSIIGDGGGLIEKTEIAGPGFINYFVKTGSHFDILRRIEKEGDSFGRVDAGKGIKVLLEFVSANPTGPLHVGHARGAVFGDALASIMNAGGYKVTKEYYINDAGLQIKNLGLSVFERYRQLISDEIKPLENKDLYQGEYIIDHARALREKRGDDLSEEDIPELALWAAERILEEIRGDLAAIGVKIENYFSEKSLHDSGAIKKMLDDLREKDLVYEKDGALWFRSGDLWPGDEDRVLIKSGGEATYMTSDIAYHAEKIGRGFDEMIDVWGADHHGYIPRMKAAIKALGKPPEMLTLMLIQMVNLTRGSERISMSTRAGKFVTLREVVKEVGKDAARFFFLMRRHDSQLDFDLDLAKEKSNQNPVFYVQYMHARICSIFAKAREGGVEIPSFDNIDTASLIESEETQIAQHLSQFPEVVRRAALQREPHRLTRYLSELAGMFHPYYYKHRIVGEDPALSAARLHLCGAVRQVARNALAMIDINAPVSM